MGGIPGGAAEAVVGRVAAPKTALPAATAKLPGGATGLAPGTIPVLDVEGRPISPLRDRPVAPSAVLPDAAGATGTDDPAELEPPAAMPETENEIMR